MKKTLPSLSYLAGYFDGEGSIGLYISSSRSSRYKSGFKTPSWSTQVKLGACYKPNVNAFSYWFGGNVRPHDRATTKHRRSFIWRLCNKKDIIHFLQAIIPYLREKKPQAELMLRVLLGKVSAAKAAPRLRKMKKFEF